MRNSQLARKTRSLLQNHSSPKNQKDIDGSTMINNFAQTLAQKQRKLKSTKLFGYEENKRENN